VTRGEGDPVLNFAFKFIGQADEKGVFRWSGSEIYVLPLSAKGLAFSAEVSDVAMPLLRNPQLQAQASRMNQDAGGARPAPAP